MKKIDEMLENFEVESFKRVSAGLLWKYDLRKKFVLNLSGKRS